MTDDLAMRDTLVGKALELVVPLSGEVIRLDRPDEVAGARAWLVRAEEQLKEARAILDGHLHDEARRLGAKTFRAGVFKVEMTPDTETEWDIEKLRDGLTAAGCPEERINDLIRETVTVEHKVNASVAKQMMGANEAYKEAITAAQTIREKRPYAKVSRRR